MIYDMAEQLNAALALTEPMFASVTMLAWGLMGALGCLAWSFTGVRSLFVGRGGDYAECLLRIVLCVALLVNFDAAFDAITGSGADLTSYFMDQASWDELVAAWSSRLQPLLLGEMGEESGQGPLWQRLWGLAKGGPLAWTMLASYFFTFLAFQLVMHLALVTLSLLHVLGPLMVVGGVFAGSATVRQWFVSLLQVSLWPCMPPLLLALITKTSYVNAADTDNLAFIVGQNVCLAFLSLLSPIVVSFLVGQGGIAAFGAGAMAPVSSTVRRAGAGAAGWVGKEVYGGARGAWAVRREVGHWAGEGARWAGGRAATYGVSRRGPARAPRRTAL